jgi:hypothetical protein
MAETPRTTSNDRRRRERQNFLIVGSVLAVLALALAFAARDVWTASEVEPVPAKPLAAIEPPVQMKPPAEPESNFIDDDGASLWVSPTDGPPLDLAWLPPGVEVILAMRPEALASHPEGEKVLDAVTPVAQSALQQLRNMLPGVHGVTHAVFGFNSISDGKWPTTVVVRLSGHDSASSYIASNLAPARKEEYHNKAIWVANQWAYFVPGGADDLRLVVASPETMREMIDLAGNPPPFRPNVERVLSHTDATRFVTVVAEPSVLFHQPDPLFTGEMLPLQPAIESFLGDDVAAASLSIHWGDDFFVELIAVPTLDSSPQKMSEVLAEKVNELPRQIEEFVLKLQSTPYSRRVVARLPEMVRRLAAYTRHGYDKNSAILRCYLPVAAGHNLIMATELALAEGQETNSSPVADPTTSARPSASLADRLQKKTTLRFGREELEAALNMLGEDVGVPITIRGQDLQLDGITRNQLFAIDLADRPAAEILVEILRRANPDKTATSPADPRQKLVYVVGPDAVIITTRSQAAARGETLPAAFQAQ